MIGCMKQCKCCNTKERSIYGRSDNQTMVLARASRYVLYAVFLQLTNTSFCSKDSICIYTSSDTMGHTGYGVSPNSTEIASKVWSTQGYSSASVFWQSQASVESMVEYLCKSNFISARTRKEFMQAMVSCTLLQIHLQSVQSVQFYLCKFIPQCLSNFTTAFVPILPQYLCIFYHSICKITPVYLCKYW